MPFAGAGLSASVCHGLDARIAAVGRSFCWEGSKSICSEILASAPRAGRIYPRPAQGRKTIQIGGGEMKGPPRPLFQLLEPLVGATVELVIAGTGAQQAARTPAVERDFFMEKPPDLDNIYPCAASTMTSLLDISPYAARHADARHGSACLQCTTPSSSGFSSSPCTRAPNTFGVMAMTCFGLRQVEARPTAPVKLHKPVQSPRIGNAC